MLVTHYSHRLPIDYDIQRIRERARSRGPLWEDVPGLAFKAFLLREKGQYGATENRYASLYLWESDQGFTRFIAEDRFGTVVASFGRAAIHSEVVLDARRASRGGKARFLRISRESIASDTDLGERLSRAAADNKTSVLESGVVASAVSVDVTQWRLSKISLHDAPVAAGDGDATVFEILYLAQPLFDRLPQEGDV